MDWLSAGLLTPQAVTDPANMECGVHRHDQMRLKPVGLLAWVCVKRKTWQMCAAPQGKTSLPDTDALPFRAPALAADAHRDQGWSSGATSSGGTSSAGIASEKRPLCNMAHMSVPV